MKLKLMEAFAGVRMKVRVADESGKQVGEIHKSTTSGWRGGPSYRFYPDDGTGLRSESDQSVRKLLEKIGAQS